MPNHRLTDGIYQLSRLPTMRSWQSGRCPPMKKLSSSSLEYLYCSSVTQVYGDVNILKSMSIPNLHMRSSTRIYTNNSYTSLQSDNSIDCCPDSGTMASPSLSHSLSPSFSHSLSPSFSLCQILALKYFFPNS